jgi:hypothetical protein
MEYCDKGSLRHALKRGVFHKRLGNTSVAVDLCAIVQVGVLRGEGAFSWGAGSMGPAGTAGRRARVLRGRVSPAGPSSRGADLTLLLLPPSPNPRPKGPHRGRPERAASPQHEAPALRHQGACRAPLGGAAGSRTASAASCAPTLATCSAHAPPSNPALSHTGALSAFPRPPARERAPQERLHQPAGLCHEAVRLRARQAAAGGEGLLGRHTAPSGSGAGPSRFPHPHPFPPHPTPPHPQPHPTPPHPTPPQPNPTQPNPPHPTPPHPNPPQPTPPPRTTTSSTAAAAAP